MLVASGLGCGSGDSVGPGFDQLTGSGGATTTSSSTAGGGGQAEPKKGPPYPIVLSHGFLGFEEFAGLDFAAYFYQVRDHLADHDEPLVFTPAVDPFNSSAYRGTQLASKVKKILEETGHEKVNLIGHSQGGLDIRVVAHDHPEMVASVITLVSPHGGTRIADIALKVVDDPNLSEVLDFFLKTAGKALYDEIGGETSLAKPLKDFSAEGIAAFNAKYTDQPGIWYASIAGRSDWHTGGSDCTGSGRPPFISAWDDTLDPIDPLLDITEMLLDGGVGNPFPNDGLVRVKDSKWGDFLGCVPADHLDLVGHLFGDQPGLINKWDYKQFYLDLVGLIRKQGF